MLRQIFNKFNSNKRLTILLFSSFIVLLGLILLIALRPEKEEDDIPVATITYFRKPNIVGDPNFDANNLPADMKLWHTRLWEHINYTGKYPDPYSAAASGDMYRIGRVVGVYTHGLMNALRVTGDLRLLDEMVKIWAATKPGIKDVNGDGYSYWLWLIDPNYKPSYNTESHTMDEMISSSGVAMLLYAIKSNLAYRPQYASEATFWENFLKQHEETYKGVWPAKALAHAYTSQIVYFYYTAKAFDDPSRLTLAKQYTDKFEEGLVYYNFPNGRGVVWDHRLPFDWARNGQFGCQPSTYASLTINNIIALSLENFDMYASEEFMKAIAVTSSDAVLRYDYKQDKIAGTICGNYSIPGTTSPGYASDTYGAYILIWGGFDFTAVWEGPTNRTAEAVEWWYDDYYAPKRSVHPPVAMLMYYNAKSTVPSYCGDGEIDKPNGSNVNEICDDGNTVNGDFCSADCLHSCTSPATWDGFKCVTPPVCGNGIKEGVEECDDGNTTNNDGCSSLCLKEVLPPFCGNGVKESPEACDDGNTTNGDGCSSLCLIETLPSPVCGNGSLETGESCDDHNTVNFDQCSHNCLHSCSLPTIWNGSICITPNVCGNTIKEADEECDDGNTTDGDGCEADCKLPLIFPEDPVCGNSAVEDGEVCDDGNVTNFDTCSSDCQNACNNGTYWNGSACYTPNVCGNGYLESGEVCDDGNTLNGDQCSSTCANSCLSPEVWNYQMCYIPNVCGNGVKESFEECDDGNALNNDGCDFSCKIEVVPPFCGDGIVNLFEVCDDGSTANDDQCSSDCLNACTSPLIWNGSSCVDPSADDSEYEPVVIDSELPDSPFGDDPNDGDPNAGIPDDQITDDEELDEEVPIEEDENQEEEGEEIGELPETEGEKDDEEDLDSEFKDGLLTTIFCVTCSLAVIGGMLIFSFYKKKKDNKEESKKI